ncbi:MAG TPA: NFACT family protein, partial [Candidatus Polarisedimenticolia bacterium]
MDALLLEAVVAEAATRLAGQEVARVSFLGRSRYLIRFISSARDNLLVSVRPDLPLFHLLTPGGRVREAPPDRFAALLDQELAGATLSSLARQNEDRIVTLQFRLPRRDDGETERRLVIELLGRSASFLFLDGEGRIVAAARDLSGEKRDAGRGSRDGPHRLEAGAT